MKAYLHVFIKNKKGFPAGEQESLNCQEIQ